MFQALPILLVAVGVARATLNGACTIGSTPGTCISTSTCSSGGGTYASGYCPNDPADVKCCYKTSCGSGGNCRWTSQCTTGNTASELPAGLCPGPTDFNCCLPASSCIPKAVNSATITLIKQYEGFVASPAPDPVGLPTVGYGHLCQTTNCGEVPYSFPLTTTTATQLLNSDLKTYTKCISDYVKDTIKLNENQYGALVSWAFNEGCGAAQTSTLISRLNAGESPNTVASEELPKWVYAGGEVLQGLVNRRNAEIALFKTASGVISQPPC
ncbi:glycoside hydrolase family 24 protein [Macrolepiota fuliginosa MF-IS2]|uniref:Glycoside hydrolase family 24 protein n=1 Tax=Macrolepiota fuliginosa MF-IS2 TaxID=1400762 RepID=A0A9P5XJX1_9AGAR|nr:glycoside hydrolase family 24 protein [Macrolepiota fuliginosa MF-IS2]